MNLRCSTAASTSTVLVVWGLRRVTGRTGSPRRTASLAFLVLGATVGWLWLLWFSQISLLVAGALFLVSL